MNEEFYKSQLEIAEIMLIVFSWFKFLLLLLTCCYESTPRIFYYVIVIEEMFTPFFAIQGNNIRQRILN